MTVRGQLLTEERVRSSLTVCVGYEDFLDSTHLDVAFLQLMLGCLPAIE